MGKAGGAFLLLTGSQESQGSVHTVLKPRPGAALERKHPSANGRFPVSARLPCDTGDAEGLMARAAMQITGLTAPLLSGLLGLIWSEAALGHECEAWG